MHTLLAFTLAAFLVSTPNTQAEILNESPTSPSDKNVHHLAHLSSINAKLQRIVGTWEFHYGSSYEKENPVTNGRGIEFRIEGKQLQAKFIHWEFDGKTEHDFQDVTQKDGYLQLFFTELPMNVRQISNNKMRISFDSPTWLFDEFDPTYTDTLTRVK